MARDCAWGGGSHAYRWREKRRVFMCSGSQRGSLRRPLPISSISTILSGGEERPFNFRPVKLRDASPRRAWAARKADEGGGSEDEKPRPN